MNARGRGAALLVAALSTGFGVALLQLAGVLGAVTSEHTSRNGAAAGMLHVLAFVFVGLSIYCGAVVTTNTVATVVAGRTRMIALRRLLGATARAERVAIAREQLGVGAIGALAGLVGGTGLAFVSYRIAVATGTLPDSSYAFTDPTVLLPVVAVPLAGWAAGWPVPVECSPSGRCRPSTTWGSRRTTRWAAAFVACSPCSPSSVARSCWGSAC